MPLLPLAPSRFRWLAIAAGACLAGCGGSQVIVESAFPTPLIEPLPVSMGIIIPDELYNFIYTEDIPDQSLWTIALGDANVAMLAPLFKGMFSETRDVESLAVGGGRQHIGRRASSRSSRSSSSTCRPASATSSSRSGCSIKSPSTSPTAGPSSQWPVSGYGKSELIRDPEDAVQRAAVVAMREAGATIATKFSEQPQVKTWLGGKGHAAPVTIGPQAAVDESPPNRSPAPLQ